MAGPYAIQTPADVTNLALGKIGYKLRVGNLLDGSEASNKTLDIYAQTRDVVLRDNDWSFSQREVVGTVLKAAPQDYFDNPWNPATNPPIGWQYTYQLPDNYLKIRSIRPPPTFLLNMAPTPTLFSVINDNGYTPPRRVIAANTPEAVIVYTAQIFDLTQWTVDGIEAFAAALAQRLAAALASLDVRKVEAQEEAVTAAVASAVQG